MHGQVVDRLGQRILRGDVQPGHALPPETELCEELGVSRGALREAIKALRAKGLVDPRPRIGTRVRPREQWNFLDPDVLRWGQEADRNALLADLSDLRSAVEPAAASAAALRGADAELQQASQAFSAMETAANAADHPAFNQADYLFHRAILRASHNDLFVSLGNAIDIALHESFNVSSQLPGAMVASLPRHRAVLNAVLAHDAHMAAQAAVELVMTAVHDLTAMQRTPRQDSSQPSAESEHRGAQ